MVDLAAWLPTYGSSVGAGHFFARSAQNKGCAANGCDRCAAAGAMSKAEEPLETRIDRLHAHGIVDLHFDLLIDLYEKRNRPGVLVSHFLAEFAAGDIGTMGVAIYIEDRYLPEMGLRVALDQVGRLYAEVEQSDRFAVCRSFSEIKTARGANKIALLITMEGVEPLGN